MDKLKRYKGELNREQLIAARTKIVNNAKALCEEATILYEHEKYARAYFLLCIANEELGKSVIVTSAVVNLLGDNIDWKKFWRRLRKHTEKTAMVEFMENVFFTEDDNFLWLNDYKKNISTMEEIKMMSLYSDMILDNFYEPCEVISKTMAEEYLKLTKNRIDFITSIGVSDNVLRELDKETARNHIERWNKF